MKHKIVACIPTKDTAWIQPYILKHLSEFCDTIIVSDDNSTDNTYDVCASFEKVEYFKRPIRLNGDRQGALQRQEILERAYKHDPDYFLFLDADEMPSPNIVPWLNSLGGREEEKVNTWSFPWVHLWGDDKHYRVDRYDGIHWEPFTNTYRKGFLCRNIPGFEMKYDLSQHRCRPSNQPANVPGPIFDVQGTPTGRDSGTPLIMHYGKISEYFTSGQNWRDRSEWDNYENGADIRSTLDHHIRANSTATLELKEVKEEWFWK